MLCRQPGAYRGFVYQGVLVSSGDLHIDTYKPASKCAYYTANNHGSMVEIGGEWYIFYHRHTNGTNFSRPGLSGKAAFPAGRHGAAGGNDLLRRLRAAAGPGGISRLSGLQPVQRGGKNLCALVRLDGRPLSQDHAGGPGRR